MVTSSVSKNIIITSYKKHKKVTVTPHSTLKIIVTSQNWNKLNKSF